jgi:hypothetical protein
VLIGLSYALLDFMEEFQVDFPELVIIETGGMKGRRRELTRAQLQSAIKAGFGSDRIHSEYGMTELLSQAYSTGGGLFRCSPTMRVQIRELTDPFCTQKPGRPGVIQVIDLANIDTCSFISTEDIGSSWSDGTFEVHGRLDVAEMRGCNLMVE